MESTQTLVIDTEDTKCDIFHHSETEVILNSRSHGEISSNEILDSYFLLQ